jgi:hypothetical protein
MSVLGTVGIKNVDDLQPWLILHPLDFMEELADINADRFANETVVFLARLTNGIQICTTTRWEFDINGYDDEALILVLKEDDAFGKFLLTGDYGKREMATWYATYVNACLHVMDISIER